MAQNRALRLVKFEMTKKTRIIDLPSIGRCYYKVACHSTDLECIYSLSNLCFDIYKSPCCHRDPKPDRTVRTVLIAIRKSSQNEKCLM